MKQGEKQFVEQQLANATSSAPASSPSTSSADFWSRFVPATMYDLNQAIAKIKQYIDMNDAELQARLNAIAANLQSGVDEINAEIAALKASLSNVQLSAESVASLQALSDKVQKLVDDNAPPPPAAS